MLPTGRRALFLLPHSGTSKSRHGTAPSSRMTPRRTMLPARHAGAPPRSRHVGTPGTAAQPGRVPDRVYPTSGDGHRPGLNLRGDAGTRIRPRPSRRVIGLFRLCGPTPTCDRMSRTVPVRAYRRVDRPRGHPHSNMIVPARLGVRLTSSGRPALFGWTATGDGSPAYGT